MTIVMSTLAASHREPEKAGWALAWLLGVPLPLLLVIYAISRC